ncbi:MAG: GNAT family N-acetyltransferase [Clostridium sp.]|nr:GNAT family N-acetyltransferase [Clostridium sp.]
MKRLANLQKAEDLFAGWQEGCIWSAMQGIMGDVYVDDEENPTCGAVVLGDFQFLAGRPNRELVRWKADCGKADMILVPEHDGWNGVIEDCYGGRAKKVVRYAIKKEQDIFDRNRLEQAVSDLSAEYRAAVIDEALFNRCLLLDWCRDGMANYPDYDLYRRYGLGVVILQGEEIVASCSSYSGFRNGIEIQVDTRADHRRKGLAYACAAKLILECLDREWLPSWDAQNLMSVGLAKKLGYHFDREYTAYEIK